MGHGERFVRKPLIIMFVAILHDIRSAYNVGSIFRTADGAGFAGVFLTGYTPCPATADSAHPSRAERDLAKTALGAERSVPWERFGTLSEAVASLKERGFEIIALEQTEKSVPYDEYIPSSNSKIALLVGTEVTGLRNEELVLADAVIEIPMRGTKESLNVSVAFGIAAYAITGTMNT